MKYIHSPSDFPTLNINPNRHSVRIFVDLEGVLMNFTKAAAIALDQMDIPIDNSTGLISPNPVYSRTTNEILYDVCHGYDFYKSLEKYPWADIVFEELFKASRENVYFLARQNTWDRESWGGKAQWVWENFGEYGYNHLLMVSDSYNSPLRYKWTEKDILIDDMLSPNIERWCQCGGNGFWWPELDWRADQAVITKELYRRIAGLKTLIATSG